MYDDNPSYSILRVCSLQPETNGGKTVGNKLKKIQRKRKKDFRNSNQSRQSVKSKRDRYYRTTLIQLQDKRFRKQSSFFRNSNQNRNAVKTKLDSHYLTNF